jgi:hypothetical protein
MLILSVGGGIFGYLIGIQFGNVVSLLTTFVGLSIGASTVIVPMTLLMRAQEQPGAHGKDNAADKTSPE